MKLTKNLLEKLGACSEGKDALAAQNETDAVKVLRLLVADKKLDWANWLVVRLLGRKDKIRYAIFAAEQVIDIFEKKYPEDKRPRLAISAAKKVLEKNSKENLDAAAYAAYAANAAAYAAYAAADAAYAAYAAADAADAAANAAANAAAYAANSANAAANAAAYAAYAAYAADAANAEMKTRIIEHGIVLLAKPTPKGAD